MFYCTKDNQSIKSSNLSVEIAAFTTLGDREEQQDCCGFELKSHQGLVVLCDGMGGHKGGKIASNIAVNSILSQYIEKYPINDAVSFLRDATITANQCVNNVHDDNNIPIQCGSTMVSAYIDDNLLYWNSVGDSRAYLLRNKQFAQFTLDHNYGTVLKEKLNAGLISSEMYAKESNKSETLISYLGMDNLQLIDYNNSPLQLLSKDKVVIMSDGLYKLLPNQEISKILDNFNDIAEALQVLDMKAKRIAKQKKIIRDNMTVIIIKIF